MTDNKKPAIWTPDQKLPDRVKKLAMMLFVEAWKAFQNALDDDEWDTADVYRDCIEQAKIVIRIEDETEA